jgi:peroxiredoxin Q/BCP
MALKIGETVPNFTFTDHNGSIKKFYEVSGKKIVFFFPKAFTAGCTRQSISMQENYELLKTGGVTEVFGISVDGPDVLDKFCQKYDFEYIMVSDQTYEISKGFGVFKNKIIAKYADRDTFIIDENNKIEKIMRNGLTGKNSELGLGKHGIEIRNFLNI